MTGLVLVFLLIVVIMISSVYGTLVRYENTKKEIYQALADKFFHEEQDNELTVSEDLVIQFLDPDVLFEQDSTTLSDSYKKFLDGFIPKYLQVLEDEKFARHIHEVRIEGHTAKPSPTNPRYINLVELSQGRARAILHYFVSSRAFKQLDNRKKSMLRFKLITTGFGNGRMINADGQHVIESRAGKYVVFDPDESNNSDNDPSKPDKGSRRVEFRIVTNAERIIADALK